MERWTNRKYVAALDWIDDQWNHPGRTDQYLMQIAAEIRRVLHKKPNSVKVDHFKLRFVRPTPQDYKNQDSWNKQIWLARVGYKKPK